MIIVIIKMASLPAKRKELFQTVHALIQSIRKENGCIKCSACQDIEDENSFLLLEKWETQQDLDHYLRSDLFTVLLGAKNLMSEPLEIKFNTVSFTAGMEAVKTARGKTR